jgi:hypothetical protein
MKTKERMLLLTEWKNQYEYCSKVWNMLDKVIRIECDSMLGNALWGTFEKYTDVVSKLVGDTGTWLSWYCWENDMGQRNFEAQASSWKKERKICNLSDLCQIIEADIVEVKPVLNYGVYCSNCHFNNPDDQVCYHSGYDKREVGEKEKCTDRRDKWNT